MADSPSAATPSSPEATNTSIPSPTDITASPTGHGRSQATSGATGRLRSASLKFMESSPPVGFMSATGEVMAKAPSLLDIRRGSFGSNGWDEEGQRRSSSIASGKARKPSLSRSNTAQSPTITTRGQRTPSGPLPNDIDEIGHEDDGFPDLVFGRGEMTNQSYVKGPKKTPAIAADAADDDLDDETIPQRRNSKNLKAMFGESPRPSTSAEPLGNRGGEKPVPDADGMYPNGYRFPPKHTWGEATMIGLKASWKFILTPLGFLIVLYGLNVVAWGGMLFLLLIPGAAPQMCYPAHLNGQADCNDIDAPRRIWIEIDSQILNALFCVTGFGLIPWRFRDWYYLLQFRICKSETAFRKLAGIHRSWFRLPGSDQLPVTPRKPSDSPFATPPPADRKLDESNSSIPLPLSKIPDPPLTGVRAPPTPLWKLDYVIGLFVLNTFLQAVLSGFMWGLNRYNRPSWSTGLFVALACTVAAMAGFMQFQEGKRIKKYEGIPVSAENVIKDVERSEAERKNEKGK